MERAQTSLEAFIKSKQPNLVDYFYNEAGGPHFRIRSTLLNNYIPPEFTNWREEHRAWRETAVVFDLSHHMPVLLLKGRNALSLLQKLSINDLSNFGPDRAKQFIGCTPRGHVIGDCIAYCHAADNFELISGMPILNWVHFQAEKSGLDLEVQREAATPFNKTGRRIKYRFQIDGPNAAKILNDAVKGGLPEIPFFRTARVEIGGHNVLILRHGMAGHMGAELSGAYEEADAVRSAILEAGEPHGIKRGGLRSYFSASFESGWIAYPMPGIYTGDELKEYREWLPADCWEADAQIGGSYYRPNIEDYYVTPWDLGYGRLLKFSHDFVGRSALETMANKPHRTKVTLVWNHDDLAAIYRSQFGDGPRYKAHDLPAAVWAQQQADEVFTHSGEFAGISTRAGYSANEREGLSLAMIDERFAKIGTELVLTWGEPNGGSRKPTVERHEQTKVRVTVGPVPYAKQAREMRGPGH